MGCADASKDGETKMHVIFLVIIGILFCALITVLTVKANMETSHRMKIDEANRVYVNGTELDKDVVNTIDISAYDYAYDEATNTVTLTKKDNQKS